MKHRTESNLSQIRSHLEREKGFWGHPSKSGKVYTDQVGRCSKVVKRQNDLEALS